MANGPKAGWGVGMANVWLVQLGSPAEGFFADVNHAIRISESMPMMGNEHTINTPWAIFGLSLCRSLQTSLEVRSLLKLAHKLGVVVLTVYRPELMLRYV